MSYFTVIEKNDPLIAEHVLADHYDQMTLFQERLEWIHAQIHVVQDKLKDNPESAPSLLSILEYLCI